MSDCGLSEWLIYDLLLVWFQSCRANEICDSFDSCLSDTNCQEVARKNRQDKEKQQQKQLDHVTILPKTAGIDWLRPAANQSPASETTPQLSVLYSDSNNDYSQWLRRPVPAVAHKIKDDVNLQVKIQSLSLQSPKCDDNQWLRSSPNLKDDCKESIIKEAVDMMQSPWSQWLRCWSNSSQLSWSFKMFYFLYSFSLLLTWLDDSPQTFQTLARW